MQLIKFIFKRKFNRYRSILSTTRIYQSATLIILLSLFVVIIFFIKTTLNAIHDVQITKNLRIDFQNLHVSFFVTKTLPLTDVSVFDYNKE